MADGGSAASTESTAIAKDPVDTQQSAEVTHTVESSGVSIVSPKHSMEGNGDGKSGKPGKDGTGSKGGKSPENEVFIPAPPPATNAWTIRMQASCAAAKPAAKTACQSPSADDKNSSAPLLPDSNKPASAAKQSPNSMETDPPMKNDPQSRLRLECSTQTESVSSSPAVCSSKHASAESAENLQLPKQTVDAKSKPGSEALSKAEVSVKSTSSALDTAPGGCWKKPATATRVQSVSDPSVAQASSTNKQNSAEQPAGV